MRYGPTAGVLAAAAVLLMAAGACDDQGGVGGPASASAVPSRSSVVLSGIETKPAKEILAAAFASLRKARSVHYVFHNDSQQTGVDLWLTQTSAKGTMALRGENGPARVRVILVPPTTAYLQGREFWRYAITQRDDADAGNAAASLVGDRWVKARKSSDLPWDLPFTNVQTLTQQKLGKGLDSGQTFSKGEQKVVDGRPAIAVRSEHATMYVATTGEPQLLRMTKPDGSLPESFSGYNDSVTITPPPDPVDYAALQNPG